MFPRPFFLLLAGALCLVIATPAHAQRLKIATVLPEGSSWMREMRSAAAEVRKQTGGRVEIKLYPGGVMGSETTVLRKMRVGQLHGGAFTSGSLRDLYPDVDLYSLPLMFRTFEEVDYVRERMDPALRAGLEEAGLVVLAISDGGFAYLLSQKPIRNIGDLSGSKVWVQESDVMSRTALEIAGVAPVPLPIADVYTGLQTGLLDTLAVPPMAAIAFQWHTKVKYISDVPLMYLIGVLAIDQRAFARLRPEDGEALLRIMAESSRRLDAESRAGHAQALQALADQGVQPVSTSSDEELERWYQIADLSLGKLRQDGVYSADLIDTVLTKLGEYRGRPPATHAR